MRNDGYDVKIIEYTDSEPSRKRACINCGLRDLWGYGSRCGYDGSYISYINTWDGWCRHWKPDERKPGEIGIYDEEGKRINGRDGE